MDPKTKKLIIILGIIGSLLIIGGIVAIVLVLKTEPDGDGNGNGDGDGDGDGEESKKYNIISPWNNPEKIDVPTRDFGGINECADNFEEQEEGIGFGWNTLSNLRDYADPDHRPTACTIRSDATNDPADNNRTNSYLFELDPEGIDLNQWSVHLGINNAENLTGGSSLTLGECAEKAKDDDYTTFFYNFQDGMCYHKEEITPTFPWGINKYFPGALFIPQESEFNIVSTEGTTCEDMGMDYITDSDECLDAGEELGLSPPSDIDLQVFSRNETNRPKGCFWNTTQVQSWVNEPLNLAPNGEDGTQIKYSEENDSARLQICKRR